MKKLLMSGAAVLALASVAGSAQAEGLTLDISGHFKGYAVFTDQEETAASDLRGLDFRKETEIHFTGETTLDNGLTVGAHVELDVDRAENNDEVVEESYMYLSGGWGRVNFGEEDGAAYLLQVAAPSADSNIDGLRQYINTFDLSANGGNMGVDTLDYDMDPTGKANKLTYFTPVFNGFQVGASFTPSVVNVLDTDLEGTAAAVSDNDDDTFGSAYEIAFRYEGDFEGVGVTFGAGYVSAEQEDDTNNINVTDDYEGWNVGLDLDIGAFGLGASYSVVNNGISDDGDTEIMVLGADYMTGPYKLGLSYYDREDEQNAPAAGAAEDIDTSRLTGGVSYEYGPGMSFRGSIAYIDVEETGVDDYDAYQIAIGTQVKF